MSNKHIVHIVKYRWLWMILSALLLLPGIIAMGYSMVTYSNHAPLKVGIDYTGGTISQFAIPEKVRIDDKDQLATLRKGLDDAGIENPYIQILGVTPTAENKNVETIISVRTKFIDKDSQDLDKISTVMQNEFPKSELISVNSVGPTFCLLYTSPSPRD